MPELDLATVTAADGRDLLAAAETDWLRPVPHRPGWNAADLVGHMGAILGWIARIIATGERVAGRDRETPPAGPAALAGMSHHFDSPTAIEDGRLNLCDLYVFPETPGTSTLVLTVNPDSGRSNPTTFRSDALYEFVIASDGGTREDRAFRMSFGEPDADGNQEMQVRYPVGPPSRSGLEGTELGGGHTGEAFALGNGGSAWFGLAQDPFWGDAVALFAFNQGLAENQYRPELLTGTPGNLLGGRNVTAIALQVPDVMFGGGRGALPPRRVSAGRCGVER